MAADRGAAYPDAMPPVKQDGITDAQARVLEALRVVTADGWPASVRELGEVCGMSSTSTVWYHLLALEEAGVVKAHPRASGRRGGWLPVERLPEGT